MAKPKCPVCRINRMAGVLDQPKTDTAGVPLPSGERFIERCDTCARFGCDEEAAIHYATRFGGHLRYDQRVIIWTPATAPCTCFAIGTVNVPDTNCPQHGERYRAAIREFTETERGQSFSCTCEPGELTSASCPTHGSAHGFSIAPNEKEVA